MKAKELNVKQRDLTDKQKMFCHEYLIDLNATQACIRAGYSEKTAEQIGYQQLQKTLVREHLQQLMDIRAKKVDITAEYVLENIKKVGERCMNYIQPILEKDGTPTGEYVFKEQGALKALELLGKHLQLFTDVVKLQGEVKWTKEEIDAEYNVVKDYFTELADQSRGNNAHSESNSR